MRPYLSIILLIVMSLAVVVFSTIEWARDRDEMARDRAEKVDSFFRPFFDSTVPIRQLDVDLVAGVGTGLVIHKKSGEISSKQIPQFIVIRPVLVGSHFEVLFSFAEYSQHEYAKSYSSEISPPYQSYRDANAVELTGKHLILSMDRVDGLVDRLRQALAWEELVSSNQLNVIGKEVFQLNSPPIVDYRLLDMKIPIVKTTIGSVDLASFSKEFSVDLGPSWTDIVGQSFVKGPTKYAHMYVSLIVNYSDDTSILPQFKFSLSDDSVNLSRPFHLFGEAEFEFDQFRLDGPEITLDPLGVDKFTERCLQVLEVALNCQGELDQKLAADRALVEAKNVIARDVEVKQMRDKEDADHLLNFNHVSPIIRSNQTP